MKVPPLFSKYTGIASILNPNPLEFRLITMGGFGEPGTGENDRPGEESRELDADWPRDDLG